MYVYIKYNRIDLYDYYDRSIGNIFCMHIILKVWGTVIRKRIFFKRSDLVKTGSFLFEECVASLKLDFSRLLHLLL